MYATMPVLPVMAFLTLVCNLLELPVNKYRLTRLTKPPEGMVGGRRVLFYSLVAASLMGDILPYLLHSHIALPPPPQPRR